MSKMKDLYQDVTEPNYEAYVEYEEAERDKLRHEGQTELFQDLYRTLSQARIRYEGTDLISGIIYAIEALERTQR
jgi:hypothetical protein